MSVKLDRRSKAMIEDMREHGFGVTISPRPNDRYWVVARDGQGNELHADGTDLFRVLSDLAVAVYLRVNPA